ncbi:carbohydrate ABC transporter permease [Paenibacillus nasutitermitis]|uniref:Sugar ABC transporter permease n=1 Tax=Paenibacillus nasutitermitis TaxID=1652958 RepID=A0A916YIA7_9BACL|nr:sugar ABC transporter permease [Paenibacillus nasutitermitis]GGD46893.1 sugar ABC transporter permease [Paenibacillus nasutitermitis]
MSKPVMKAHALKKKEAIAGYLFTLPAILGLLIWTIGPMIASLVISLTDWQIISGANWVGFDNYKTIFTDDLFFKKSLLVTVYFALGSVVFTMLASIIVALFMNYEVKGQALFRTVFYLPTIVPAVASSMLWVWLFNPDFGLLNAVLKAVGLPSLMWIYDETTVIPSLILMSMWGCGSAALIILAGLQDVPKHLLEAVEIDGGNSWHKFRFVTVPMITPVIFFNLVMGLIGSLQAFTQAYVMTGGGPNNGTLFYVFLIYREAFQQNHFGYASALSWILFALIAVLTAVVFKSSKGWVHYGGGK